MIKRILLIFTGIIISLVLLEVFMQTAGLVIPYSQNYKNSAGLKKKNHYKIICLGESTTFKGYPVYLQKMLDKKYPGVFSVIDCGVPGIKLRLLFDKLDEQISKYKPDFAVCMIGINDGFVASDKSSLFQDDKYNRFKIYKLYALLKRHLFFPFNASTADDFNSGDEIEDEIEDEMKEVYALYNNKRYQEASDICKKIIGENSGNVHASAFLSMLCYSHLSNIREGYEKALNTIGKINDKTPSRIKHMIYEIVIDYRIKHNIPVQDIIEKLIDEKPEVINPKIYGLIKVYATSAQKDKILNKMISYKDSADRYYGLLAIENMNKKDYKKAEEYFRAAEDIRIVYPKQSTYKYYKLIVSELLKNNVRVICMQYPVRSVVPLKKMFENEVYFDELTFVSNEASFKKMLKQKRYDELFNDQFAGDFGHYNNKSAVIISKNIITAVEKNLN